MLIEINKVSTGNGTVRLITLTKKSGSSVTLSTRGAGIVAVNVPDGSGCQRNVVAGYLPVDDDIIWDYDIVSDDEVRFSTGSERQQVILYRWTDDDVLEIYYQKGLCGCKTIDVLGQTYFNLDVDRDALSYEFLWINSSGYPDFSTATRLCSVIGANGEFEHCWRVRDWQQDVMNDVAVLASHRTGRQLSIHTSFPELKLFIPASHSGVSFSTLYPDGNDCAQQLTFLHFSVMG